MMNDFENEDLVNSLETIVEIYSDSIEPFALQICRKLSESYWRLMDMDEECDEGELGAMSCMSTIRTIFEAVHKNPELLVKLEKECFKVFAHCTTPDGMDSIEDVVACTCQIMHHANHISEEIWALAPQLLRVIVGADDEAEGGYGFEHLGSTVDFFRNIIKLGEDQLWTRTIGEEPFIQVLVKAMIKCIGITNEYQYCQSGSLAALLIAASIFENHNGKVDNYLLKFLKIGLEDLVKEGVSPYYARIICEFIFT